MISSRDQDIVDDFLSCLDYLKDSDPWAIEELTKMATNLDVYASEIVEAIEQHVRRVKQEFKLPALYLIDSIMKNSNRIYVNLLVKNLVELFFSAFEFADFETRGMMFRLRRTWSTILPITTLYLLDERIHNFDQGWPITATPFSSASSSTVTTPIDGTLDLSLKFNAQGMIRHEDSFLCHQMALSDFNMAAHAGINVQETNSFVNPHERAQEAFLSALSFLSSPEDNSRELMPRKRKQPEYFNEDFNKKRRTETWE